MHWAPAYLRGTSLQLSSACSHSALVLPIPVAHGADFSGGKRETHSRTPSCMPKACSGGHEPLATQCEAGGPQPETLLLLVSVNSPAHSPACTWGWGARNCPSDFCWPPCRLRKQLQCAVHLHGTVESREQGGASGAAAVSLRQH